MADLIRLRDLPGIRTIEELCWSPYNFDYPRSSYTQDKIDEVSIALFGITERETEWNRLFGYRPYDPEIDDREDSEVDDDDDDDDDDVVRTFAEWEACFAFTRRPLGEVEMVWRALGWDVTNDKGEELVCLDKFSRQIIATMRQLVPGAKLTLNGHGGRETEAQIQARAEAWGESLADEARRFAGRSRR